MERGALRGKESILLVDDEPMILDVGRQMLEMLGYRIFTAACGKEAVATYSREKDDLDLVVLDLMMPDMGGSEVYDRLKAINPDIPVILSSGQSVDGEASELLSRGCEGFIQKPFNLKQFALKVRETLGGEPPGNNLQRAS